MSAPSVQGLSALEGLGWRQGAVLPSALVYQLLEAGHIPTEIVLNPDTDCLMVISQDCDVVSPSLKNEPWCEVLAVKPAEGRNGNFERGKNPRQIQFDLPGLGLADCSIHDKFRFPRDLLVNHQPSSAHSVTPRQLQELRAWVVKRYTRAAFPDPFNRRWSLVRSRVSALLGAAGGGLLTEIFIMLSSDQDLPPEQPYEVALVGLMYDDDYDSVDQLNMAKEALGAVAQILDECDGIEVLDYTVRARRRMSLSELDQLLRWDYMDALSFQVG